MEGMGQVDSINSVADSIAWSSKPTGRPSELVQFNELRQLRSRDADLSSESAAVLQDASLGQVPAQVDRTLFEEVFSKLLPPEPENTEMASLIEALSVAKGDSSVARDQVPLFRQLVQVLAEKDQRIEALEKELEAARTTSHAVTSPKLMSPPSPRASTNGSVGVPSSVPELRMNAPCGEGGRRSAQQSPSSAVDSSRSAVEGSFMQSNDSQDGSSIVPCSARITIAVPNACLVAVGGESLPVRKQAFADNIVELISHEKAKSRQPPASAGSACRSEASTTEACPGYEKQHENSRHVENPIEETFHVIRRDLGDADSVGSLTGSTRTATESTGHAPFRSQSRVTQFKRSPSPPLVTMLITDVAARAAAPLVDQSMRTQSRPSMRSLSPPSVLVQAPYHLAQKSVVAQPASEIKHVSRLSNRPGSAGACRRPVAIKQNLPITGIPFPMTGRGPPLSTTTRQASGSPRRQRTAPEAMRAGLVQQPGLAPTPVADRSASPTLRIPSSQARSVSPVRSNVVSSDIVFFPGRIGISYEDTSGKVLEVDDGPARQVGVKSGWLIKFIDGLPFDHDLFVSKLNGARSYKLTFQYQRVLSGSASGVPSEGLTTVVPRAGATVAPRLQRVASFPAAGWPAAITATAAPGGRGVWPAAQMSTRPQSPDGSVNALVAHMGLRSQSPDSMRPVALTVHEKHRAWSASALHRAR